MSAPAPRCPFEPPPDESEARTPPPNREWAERLRRWFSCPNLVKPPDDGPLAAPELARPAGAKAAPLRKRAPGLAGAQPRLRGGIKVGLSSAGDLWSAQVHIGSMGLLADLGLRVGSFSFHITSDLLDSGRWLIRPAKERKSHD